MSRLTARVVHAGARFEVLWCDDLRVLERIPPSSSLVSVSPQSRVVGRDAMDGSALREDGYLITIDHADPKNSSAGLGARLYERLRAR